jgi:hypothetical protein
MLAAIAYLQAGADLRHEDAQGGGRRAEALGVPLDPDHLTPPPESRWRIPGPVIHGHETAEGVLLLWAEGQRTTAA